MKKLVMVVMVLLMGGMPVMAAETQTKDYYKIVIDGIDEEIREVEEEDEGLIVSAKKTEVPSEKVTTYRISGYDNDELVTVFIYINGETQEVYAMTYDSEGTTIDTQVMTLKEAADLYE